MRTALRRGKIGAMKRLQRNKKPSRLRASGMELAGALSIASQMAMVYPPGFDQWAYRELSGGTMPARQRPRRP